VTPHVRCEGRNVVGLLQRRCLFDDIQGDDGAQTGLGPKNRNAAFLMRASLRFSRMGADGTHAAGTQEV
jgi:hypothetical protein